MTLDDWRARWSRFKIFCWYLGTEPIRQLREVWRILTRAMTWAYVALALGIVAYFLGQRVLAGFSLLYVLIIVLIWEWQNGAFMHRYRQHTAQRIKKTLQVTEARRNAPLHRDRRQDP